MGGTLAQPTKTFPKLFAPNTIFDKFPFLLPNLVCTVVLIFGVAIGILFLEETHKDKKSRQDYGLDTGRWLLRRLKIRGRAARSTATLSDKSVGITIQESLQLMDDEELPEYSPADGVDLPGYRTTDGTPRQSSSRCHSPSPRHAINSHTSGSIKVGTSGAFTKQVILTIAAFGILA